jgi:hypothetical protein
VRTFLEPVLGLAAAQAAGDLPSGDTERAAALIQSTAHGAIDLALSGHLSRRGKGDADPHDLLDDLFGRLSGESAARVRESPASPRL